MLRNLRQSRARRRIFIMLMTSLARLRRLDAYRLDGPPPRPGADRRAWLPIFQPGSAQPSRAPSVRVTGTLKLRRTARAEHRRSEPVLPPSPCRTEGLPAFGGQHRRGSAVTAQLDGRFDLIAGGRYLSGCAGRSLTARAAREASLTVPPQDGWRAELVLARLGSPLYFYGVN